LPELAISSLHTLSRIACQIVTRILV